MLPLNHWIVVAATVVAVVLSATAHYEGLRLMSDKIKPLLGLRRQTIVLMILWLIMLHIVEIWIFGITYYILLHAGDFGQLEGTPVNSIFDCVYFSAAVFSTLGFGDIVPVGPIRFVTGTEAVTGLTLITWSASYTFLQMTRIWNPDD